MAVDRYVPERFDSTHFKVLIETAPCAGCGSPTAPNLQQRRWPFRKTGEATFEAQLGRAGVRLVGSYDRGEKPVCGACTVARLARHCELCKGAKPEADMQLSLAGQYSLCKECYAKTPAAVWDAKVASLLAEADELFVGPL